MSIKRLDVVGFGPGDMKHMTVEAVDAINDADIVVGYKTYVDLVKEMFPSKEYQSTGMGSEKERVILALSLANDGKRVALVCSGDSSIYGMAALTYELSKEYPEVNITTISGVTAAISASALLGAVAGNDFCTISLSDYHTSWENILRRLRSSAECDFVIALYNTRSKKRPDSLKKACDELLKVLPCERYCGVARSIGRPDEECFIVSLLELRDFEAGMFDTVLIGNSKTILIDGKLVTSRGYEIG